MPVCHTHFVAAPKLSVLDLAIVGEGSSHHEALTNSVDLAQAGRTARLSPPLGRRAPQHPGDRQLVAPGAGRCARREDRDIRIGSGGVMLPNHPPLVVAEQFGMLEALHPGRIDLGIGRAPGTDQITASALRRSADPSPTRTSRRQLSELIGFFKGEFSPRDPYRHVKAVPGNGDMPADLAARLVGLLGAARRHARPAVRLRPPLHAAATPMRPCSSTASSSRRRSTSTSRTRWSPARRSRPRTMSGRDTSSGPARLSMARLRAGRPTRFPTPEEAAAHEFTAEEQERSALSGSAAIGGPDTVRAKLDELAGRTQADELMITTMVHDHADRVRSYELIANSYELAGPPAIGAAAGSENT